MSDDVLEVAQATEIAQSAEIADTSETANAVETAATGQTTDTAVPTETAATAATADTTDTAATTAAAVLAYSGHSGQDHVERMRMIMLGFIDDPRKAALDADDLLADVLRSVTESLARRRRELETEPADAVTPETERLRQVVRRSRELVDILTQAV